nr:putative receptor-like protein kinase At3g47110 [Quercus suber]
MRSNFFQGVIHSSLESLRGLQVLDISKNNFFGNIPKVLESFIFLQLLNLSYNNFDGEVPTNGVFKNKSATVIMGNNKLCVGMPKFVLSIYVFSSTNLIGVGSFGFVYRGILDQDRHIVAVKVLNLLHHGASKSFVAECEALRNIRHRNLVKVLTACLGVDYQGYDFKALVYEFMSDGNLDEWLHPIARTNESPMEQKNLNLHQRLSIAIDVANALEYLHHHCHTPIVHCNLKPSNIFLNDKMIGHAGDFGLARFLLEATQECRANQSSSIGLRGTIGYAPPGKRPTNNIFKDNLNLHDFVKGALPEQVINIVDPIIL